MGGVQRGATVACHESGYHLVVESFGKDAPDIEAQVHGMLGALRPDGMIPTPPSPPPLCDHPGVLAAVHAAGTPCVLISPRAGQATSNAAKATVKGLEAE